VTELINELEINRHTLNMLTDNQKAILAKCGKYMGDLYFSNNNSSVAPFVQYSADHSQSPVRYQNFSFNKDQKKYKKLRKRIRYRN
jgi:hypothetical protein